MMLSHLQRDSQISLNGEHTGWGGHYLLQQLLRCGPAMKFQFHRPPYLYRTHFTGVRENVQTG